ncbi:ubiquitin carboxyl-terminal hydrolase 37-like isoform X2 [Alosa sapidissima]|uniref:ubiquitin carboxyl-terminal hydrolase 37-like isoform X2 n=1 Tax=Alosa sapidissima TaxID=34773 RepID=UPI001C0817EE|nr:ubiquitin carboxyl-terminal hydrolase 37-like isoform X2 [Alosa sapidissima]XP_041964346.1 ubiquitin carboxyl-terminal hydrolase 37-like isoform X2 [Alosa sapidissima]
MGCCCSKQDNDEDDISPALLHRKAVVSPSISSTSSLPLSKTLTRSSSCPVLSFSTLSSRSAPSLSHSSPNLASSRCNPLLPHPSPTQYPTAESPQRPVADTHPSSGLRTNLQLLGFPNNGNTCYLNATMQGLLGLVFFNSDIMEQIQCWRGHSFAPLLRNMANLQQSRQNPRRAERKGQILKKIQRCISKICPHFHGDHQQDAHEFLVFCLIKIKEEGEALSKLGLLPRCPVANLEFQLLSVRTCNSCRLSVERREDYNHLSIPSSHQGTVTDSLAQFFKTTELEWACSSCPGRAASEELQFVTLPRVLVLHLKRFGGVSLQKSECSIGIAPELSLPSHQQRGGFVEQLMPSLEMPYYTPSTSPASSHSSSSSLVLRDSGEGAGEPDSMASHLIKTECNTTTYHLESVVSHLGDSMESGHYICDVAEGDGSTWLCFNDNIVSRKTKEDVLQERASTAYLLFYVKSEEGE